MERFNDIVTEIRRLIDEQVKTLQGELTEEECMDYAERSRRIKGLLEQLGRSASMNTRLIFRV